MRKFEKKWPPPFGEESHSANQNTGFQSDDNKKQEDAMFCCVTQC